jgi:cupin superfamily acireductone dioxygenase involved in methionine salvage
MKFTCVHEYQDRGPVIPNGLQHWINLDEAALELGYVPKRFVADLPKWIETMRTDAGQNLGFTRVVARQLTP